MYFAATRFFRAPLPGSCTKENGLAALAPIHDLGRGWAESGSQLVLMHADRPSIANIQACEVLCFYWFAVGELDRNAMHFSKPLLSAFLSNVMYSDSCKDEVTNLTKAKVSLGSRAVSSNKKQLARRFVGEC